MKEFIKRYFIIFPIVIFLGLSLFSHSCANTTQAPTGGPKDTIPPVLVKITPLPGSKKVPTHGTQVYFGFNEYVKVSNGTSIYLSPPQKKAPKYKIKGKGVLVYFEEDLLPNTTYTLDITNAIQDNNEGNNFPGYTTVFSTGDAIDSMMITGTVMDCNTLLPVKNATVMLYKKGLSPRQRPMTGDISCLEIFRIPLIGSMPSWMQTITTSTIQTRTR
jgi:hypothetical protein